MTHIYLPNGDCIYVENVTYFSETPSGNIDLFTDEKKKEYMGTIHVSGIIMLCGDCKHYTHSKNE